MTPIPWPTMTEGSFFILPSKRSVGGARRSLRRYLSQPDNHLSTDLLGHWELRDRPLPDGMVRCTLVFRRTLTLEKQKYRKRNLTTD